jgi:hypothetical protein
MLFEMLGGNPGEVTLTENFAMLPTSAVSGFYFAHRDSQYFGVARIGRDQLEDYARRRGVPSSRRSAGCGRTSIERLFSHCCSLPARGSTGARERDPARARRRRTRRSGRRGRACDRHAHQAGLARLLGQSGRCRAADEGELAASARFSMGQLRYPVPTRLTIAGLMNYVYERDYAVLTRLKVPPGARGTVPIRAEAQWLACTDEICVPESGKLSLDLPVGTGTPNRGQFDEWRRDLPQPLASLAKFEIDGDVIRLGIPLPEHVRVEEPYVFPAADGPVDYAGKQNFRRSGDLLIAELPRRRGEPERLSGVLALGDGRGLEFEAVPGEVPRAAARSGGLAATRCCGRCSERSPAESS